MPLTLQYKSPQSLPVDLRGCTPDAFRDSKIAELRTFRVGVGNQQVELAELFDIQGDPTAGEWHFEGNLAGVHHLGTGMKAGTIRIDGSAGRHCGSEMRGGTIHITGDAGDMLGVEMRGGRIEVAGNAGNLVGGAYRGSPRGMRGGQILVRGNAGDEVAHTMRRGWITIAGDCGTLAGYRMRAGSLFVLGTCGSRPGAEMVRGTIGLFGPGSNNVSSSADRPTLLPTFRPACQIAPQFLSLMRRELKQQANLEIPAKINLWNGDLLTGGKGEILLPA